MIKRALIPPEFPVNGVRDQFYSVIPTRQRKDIVYITLTASQAEEEEE